MNEISEKLYDYFQAYNYLNVGVVATNSQNQIVFANNLARSKLDFVVGKKCHETFFNSPTSCKNCPLGHNTELPLLNNQQSLKIGGFFFKTSCEIRIINEEKYIINTLTDITSETLLTRTLKKSKKKYKDIVHSGSSIILRLKSDGEIIFVNKEVEKLLGYRFDEIIGGNFTQILSADQELQEVTKKINTSAENSSFIETELQSSMGEKVWVSWTLRKMYNRKGKFEEIIAIGSDITEKRQIEQENQQHEKLISSIFKAVPTGICYLKNNKVVQVNNQFCELTEYTSDQLQDKDLAILFDDTPEYEKLFTDIYKNLGVIGSVNKETIIKCRSGIYKNIMLSATWLNPEQTVEGVTISMLDISGQKEIEYALRMHQQKLRNVIDAANDAIIITDAESAVIVDTNTFASSLLGKPAIELVGSSQMDLFPNELKTIAEQNFIEDVKSGKPRLKEISVYHNEGHWVPVEISSNVFKDDDHHRYIIGLYRDISKRKHNEEILKAKNEEIAHQVDELKTLNEELLQTKMNKDKVYQQFNAIENHYKQLFNTMASGFALHKMFYDAEENPIDYIFLEVNPAFEKLTGFKKEDVINKTVSEVIPDADSNWIRQFQHVAREGKAYRFNNYLGDNNKFYEGVAYSPEKDYFAVLFNDITERVKAEEALKEREESFKALTENSPDITMRFDKKLKILFINQSIEMYATFKKEDVIGKKLNDIINDPMIPNEIMYEIDEVFKLKNSTEKEFEINIRHHKIYFNWRFLPEFDDNGNVTSVLSLARDVTEQKKFEHQLMLAKDKAEESDRLKSAFLANMSHEVRTPMNAIIGFASLLENNNLDIERRHRFIQIIKSRSDDLMRIISDILDISSIETGQVSISNDKIDIHALFKEICDFHINKLKLLENKNVNITLALPDTKSKTIIISDRHKLNQVINNLLDNALKFTLDGEVEMGFQIQKNSILTFIRDTGIGIPENNKEMIFERFRQVEDTLTRTYGGNGLGLAICRSYVNLLGGQIWVDSKLGVGSTFYFTIPLNDKSSIK
ncbi:MAG: PAS domain S-box protein [Bacteroidetes bacterium]|jgi:PAS domain S-box-containing protein|nr:PAS domain S-box protein [Bacteroidota bacterium]